MAEFVNVVGTEEEFVDFLKGDDRNDLSQFDGRTFESLDAAKEYRDKNPQYPKIYTRVSVGARLDRG